MDFEAGRGLGEPSRSPPRKSATDCAGARRRRGWALSPTSKPIPKMSRQPRSADVASWRLTLGGRSTGHGGMWSAGPLAEELPARALARGQRLQRSGRGFVWPMVASQVRKPAHGGRYQHELPRLPINGQITPRRQIAAFDHRPFFPFNLAGANTLRSPVAAALRPPRMSLYVSVSKARS
jgi:hypothetical protein